MEHAINHIRRFKLYLEWLFHTVKCYIYIKLVWNTPLTIL